MCLQLKRVYTVVKLAFRFLFACMRGKSHYLFGFLFVFTYTTDGRLQLYTGMGLTRSCDSKVLLLVIELLLLLLLLLCILH